MLCCLRAPGVPGSGLVPASKLCTSLLFQEAFSACSLDVGLSLALASNLELVAMHLNGLLGAAASPSPRVPSPVFGTQ